MKSVCVKCGVPTFNPQHKCFPFEIGDTLVLSRSTDKDANGSLCTVLDFRDAMMIIRYHRDCGEFDIYGITVDRCGMFDLCKSVDEANKETKSFQVGDYVLLKHSVGAVWTVLIVYDSLECMMVKCGHEEKLIKFEIVAYKVYQRKPKVEPTPVEIVEAVDKDVEFWERANDYWRRQNDTLDPETGGPRMKAHPMTRKEFQTEALREIEDSLAVDKSRQNIERHRQIYLRLVSN